MADAITTITGKEYSTGIKVVTVNMVCATAAAAFTSAVLGGERGKELINVSAKAGSTGPTINSDLSIVDSVSGRDLVSGNGTDAIDNTGSLYIAPDANSITIGNLTVAVANNSVNNAETTIYLVFRSRIY